MPVGEKPHWHVTLQLLPMATLPCVCVRVFDVCFTVVELLGPKLGAVRHRGFSFPL